MSRSLPAWLFGAAVVCAGVVTVVAGLGEASPLILVVAVAGAVVSLSGGAAGIPSVLFAGAATMLGAYGLTLATGSSGAVDTLVVAILLWLHVELSIRSMELRRAVAPSPAAMVSWLSTVAAVVGSVGLMWLIVGAVETNAPSGGLLFRVLAVAAFVAVALLVSGLPIGKQKRLGPPPRDGGLPG